MNVKVALPRVHMAGSDRHYNAHFEIGEHGLALFMSPHDETPLLDIDGTAEQLHALVADLQAALSTRPTGGSAPRPVRETPLRKESE